MNRINVVYTPSPEKLQGFINRNDFKKGQKITLQYMKKSGNGNMDIKITKRYTVIKAYRHFVLFTYRAGKHDFRTCFRYWDIAGMIVKGSK